VAYDSLINLYGPATLTTTAQGTAKVLGRNRGFTGVVRVGGDVTGAGATMTATIEESATGTAGWAVIATFPAVTDEMVGYVSGTTPRYEVPGEDPLSVAFKTSKDYVRAVLTTGGTTPSFGLTSVTVQPNDTAYKISGRN
jgi:hypothetical protein